MAHNECSRYLGDSWYTRSLPRHCTDQTHSLGEVLLHCCSPYRQGTHYNYQPPTRCNDPRGRGDSSSLPPIQKFQQHKADWSWDYTTCQQHTLCMKKHQHYCCNSPQHSYCTLHLLAGCRCLVNSHWGWLIDKTSLMDRLYSFQSLLCCSILCQDRGNSERISMRKTLHDEKKCHGNDKRRKLLCRSFPQNQFTPALHAVQPLLPSVLYIISGQFDGTPSLLEQFLPAGQTVQLPDPAVL